MSFAGGGPGGFGPPGTATAGPLSGTFFSGGAFSGAFVGGDAGCEDGCTAAVAGATTGADAGAAADAGSAGVGGVAVVLAGGATGGGAEPAPARTATNAAMPASAITPRPPRIANGTALRFGFSSEYVRATAPAVCPIAGDAVTAGPPLSVWGPAVLCTVAMPPIGPCASDIAGSADGRAEGSVPMRSGSPNACANARIASPALRKRAAGSRLTHVRNHWSKPGPRPEPPISARRIDGGSSGSARTSPNSVVIPASGFEAARQYTRPVIR